MINIGWHHVHKRQRGAKKLEPYPSPRFWKHLMDRLIYFAVAAALIMTLPQIWQIYVHKNASGVSALSWGAYIVTAGVWLVYGLMHREKPIIIANIGWIILETLIVIGTIIYS